MSKSISFFLVGLLIGAACASAVFSYIGSRPGASGDSSTARVLRLGHTLPTTHPVHAGIVRMAELAAELSGGRLKVEIFPNEQLGNETQCLEQVQAGTLAMMKVSAAPIGNFVSRMNVFSLPYLFRDEAHLWKVLDGEIGQELLEKLAVGDNGNPTGFRGLCYYDAGSRNFYSKQPIQSPADIRGHKYRVMNDPVAMDTVQALGGSPAPIAYGELYTALKQGVVDGAENNPPSFVTSRHFEICKNYTLDGHSRIPDLLIISDKVWQSLSPDEQKWLRQAAQQSTAYQRDLWKKDVEKCFETMKEQGVSIFEVDTAAFREATAQVREKYAQGPIGELMRRISAE